MTSPLANARRNFRKATRRPGHVLLGSATLAIAIAVFFATCALVDGLLFTPPAFANHRDVVMYGEVARPGERRSAAVSIYDRIGLPPGALSRGLAGTVEWANAGHGSHAGLVAVQQVDAGFFPTLGVVPAIGTASFESAGEPGVMMSWRLWRAWFNGGRVLDGQRIMLDGRPCRVVGVLPPGYRLFDDVDLFIPLRAQPGAASRVPNYTAVARMLPGADIQAMEAHVRSAGRAASSGREPYGVTPVDVALTDHSAPTLWFLLGCAVLVLATACGNLANLMLARALGRSQETALRRALGAGFWGASSAAVVEAMLVGLGGFAAGCLLGHALVRAGEIYIPDAWRVNAGKLPIGWHVYLAAAVVAALVATLAALAGTLHERGEAALQGYAGSGVSRAQGTAGSIRVMMVQFQLALATVLLALCVARTALAWRMQDIPPGFEPAGAITLRFRPDPGHFDAASAVADAMSSIEQRARGFAGVTAAGVSTQLPAGTSFTISFAGTEGRAIETQLALHTVGARQALGLRLLAGRDLAGSDTAASARVAVVNEAFLDAIPGAALGSSIRKVSRSLGDRDLRIVGVVADTRDAGPTVPARPLAIMPFAQAPDDEFEAYRSMMSYYLVIRANDDASLMRIDPRTAVHAVAPWLALDSPRPLARAWREARTALERDTWLATLFAAIGLGLGLVGLYSAQRVEVATRRRDLGLCAALGARPSDLLGMCLARGVARAALGIGVGVAAAFAWSRWPPFGLAPGIRLEPAAALLVAVVMLLLTAAASWAPAWRSANTPPSLVLRHP